ncbi:hypothetical protein [Roseomonas populi]|uniref:Uncharacterized protein n=1 Tax=Roseomonas populi TaxID=3121582 RepID=A0ABT1XE66_9PROT|nr:hypothetical protein [Roseomonas pecuniae]MCR0985264.1 hypothetical protein [Roseomonas pecuniae]
MTPEPTRFEKALQRAHASELKIKRQRELIAELERAGRDDLLLAAVEELAEMTRIHGNLAHELWRAALS